MFYVAHFVLSVAFFICCCLSLILGFDYIHTMYGLNPFIAFPIAAVTGFISAYFIMVMYATWRITLVQKAMAAHFAAFREQAAKQREEYMAEHAKQTDQPS